ncbi:MULTISPECIES: prolyl oligopeptidase family protein [unclassified Bradyrhizobium]|uniref:prolyl oligopeptidase family serine peptidase n=1 Tax=unclassified Bradyrhizobium TaxID=2631580 RepID=UPI0020B389BB|nr:MULTISPECIES: prolyl oligopeptidase family serine peptidase [unclassified Bradyrhizobium]MCP3386995.1 prolyl oligopeptidase family serine peptidase [Bradyrhizobium sp. CCGUVB4N]MCP3448209.1 prolyl oligopeptidase family serine peptidase [Bradyrhizobium sp. CCGUVB14]
MSVDDRPTLSAPDDDPWLWLEEVEGSRALDFVERQNRLTLDQFGGAAFERDRDILAAIYDRSDNIPYVGRSDGLLYNLWKDATNPRGLWRRTTMAEFRKPETSWETLLDIDKLAAGEGEDWLLNWSSSLPGDAPQTILSLSRGGSDAVTMREFDLNTKSFVAGGFTLPEAKGSVDWVDADTVLLSSAYGGADMATTSGYARTVRLWRRGEPVENARVVFETTPDRMSTSCDVDRTGETPRFWFIDRLDFFNFDLWLGTETGATVKLDLPSDIWLQAHRDWFAIKLRSAWSVGGTTYAPDSVLGISLSAFLAGDRNFAILFEPGARRALQGFSWADGKLLLSILDELRPVFEICTPSASAWSREMLRGLPDIGVVDVWRFDHHESESNGDLLANVQDPLTPPSLMLIKRGVESPTVLRQAPKTFNADGLVVTQHEAISVDGERIPYVQTGPAGETGDAPVYMTAYGGFGVTIRPEYNSSLGKLWLERGGTTVQANLRGGGEFGTRWHDAGRYAGKKLSHDDFAAVAADLVRRGVTQPKRIAAQGGSNGGILITNMLVRYPERFGALFCTIPLIDMRRYTKLLAGASWIAEYGDPDKPEEWEWLKTYSAYHNAKPGQSYPPILIATTRRDDRVHPGHARKMAAKLQAMGYEAWFYEPAAGGHGYGKDNKERAGFQVLGFQFLKEKIGWRDGQV